MRLDIVTKSLIIGAFARINPINRTYQMMVTAKGTLQSPHWGSANSWCHWSWYRPVGQQPQFPAASS